MSIKEFSAVKCLVCSETFQYSIHLNQNFEKCMMGAECSNLKRHLKDDLETGLHRSQVENDEEVKVIWEKEEGRNKAVSL